MINSATTFLSIYRDLVKYGNRVSPRGQESIEIENYTYDLPPYVRFTNFECRGFNLAYVKKEFLWYLKGDRFDISIADSAKMWGGLINRDGSINSNYGQYIFRNSNTISPNNSQVASQFDNVINQLRNDKDSRRASIAILSKDHLLSDTNDVPCTYSLNFRIRDNKLNMTVRMRSQDSVYGMANDAPAFSFTHEMVLNALREFYPDLEYGNYHHSADSFHVYQRHFAMLEKITGYDIYARESVAQADQYTEVECPKISGPQEVKFLIAGKFEKVPTEFKFTSWLLS